MTMPVPATTWRAKPSAGLVHERGQREGHGLADDAADDDRRQAARRAEAVRQRRRR